MSDVPIFLKDLILINISITIFRCYEYVEDQRNRNKIFTISNNRDFQKIFKKSYNFIPIKLYDFFSILSSFGLAELICQ